MYFIMKEIWPYQKRWEKYPPAPPLFPSEHNRKDRAGTQQEDNHLQGRRRDYF